MRQNLINICTVLTYFFHLGGRELGDGELGGEELGDGELGGGELGGGELGGGEPDIKRAISIWLYIVSLLSLFAAGFTVIPKPSILKPVVKCEL